jgi:hypothetical protein
MATQSTTREQRAQSILNSGAVSLFVGRGYAEVKGSGSNVYRVTSAGCTCPDAAQRGRPCKHEIAVQSLCGEYRAWQVKAGQGERIHPSSALLQALRWPTKAAAPAVAQGCRECGAPTGFDVCSGCYFGQPVEVAA